MNFSASGIPGGAFLCTFVLFCSFQNLMYDAASILCSLNNDLAKCAPKRHILPSWGRPGEHPPGRKVLRSGCVSLHPAAKVERVWKSNQSRNAPKVEGASPAWKSNDFARKNLRQSRIGFELCTFVSWFRYIPRIFAHSACIIVASKGTPAKVGQSSGICGW